jgi:hypothetical protein
MGKGEAVAIAITYDRKKLASDDEESDEEIIRKLYEQSEYFRKTYDFFIERDGEFPYDRLKRGELSDVEFIRQIMHQAMRVCSEDIKTYEQAYDEAEERVKIHPFLANDSDFKRKHENNKLYIDGKRAKLEECEEDLRKLDEQ